MAYTFQDRLFNYLTESGHPDRLRALKILIDASSVCLRKGSDESEAKRTFNNYLNDWEKNNVFCKEGIARARKEFYQNKGQVRFIIDVDYESDIDVSPMIVAARAVLALRGKEHEGIKFTHGGYWATSVMSIDKDNDLGTPAIRHEKR